MITKIEKDGYVFSVDRDKTSEYYTMHSLCGCDGCQNFYKQIKGLFPELEKFLAEFGVNVAGPDEMPWYDINNRIQYTPYYTVIGKIEKIGQQKTSFENLNVVFYQSGSPYTDIPNEQVEPYFIIGVSKIDLPWILDTTFSSAPAKKNFIMRLLSKLKKKQCVYPNQDDHTMI